MRDGLLQTLLLAAVTATSAAQEVRSLQPTGGTRGQRVKVVCYGTFLKDVRSVVWHREGIEVEKIQAGRADRVTLHLNIPEACALGQYTFTLHTARGLTKPQAFRVGHLPSIRERQNHGTREQAQRIALNLTVDGRILTEEVDWYAFEAEAGEIVRAEVEAVRLGLSDIDLQLEIFGPDKQLLQRSDDSSLGKADPVTCFTAKKSGTHWLALRDVAYRGSSLGAYRLHLGTFPRPIGLLPAGGRPNETITVQLLGDGEPAQATITLPATDGLHAVFPVVNGQSCPTPVLVAVDDRPCFTEGASPKEPPAAPCAFHGIIKNPGAEDRYAFRATKGRRLQIRARARSLRSPLDPVLIIRDAKGKALTSNDDGAGLDGRLNFTPPATGTFFACVRDHLQRGSEAHFYRLEVGVVEAYARATEAVPGRRAEYVGIAVPQGRNNATMIRITGANARKQPTLHYASLPEGVQANTIDANPGLFVPMVFSAQTKAPLRGRLSTPSLHYKKDNKPYEIRHRHRYPVLRVGNNEVYESTLAHALPVVVTKAVPFDVATKQPRVPIVRSGSMALPITVTREKGFTGTVRIRALALPAGVSASTLTLTGKKTNGNMSFNANSGAAIGDWPTVLVASSVIDGVTCTISTKIFQLPVQEPWVTATVPRARIEQGHKGKLDVVLDHKREFAGKVTAVLGRIPKGITYKIPAIQPGMDKLPIDIDVAKATRPGRHRSIYIQLKITTKEGVITHSAGSGEIRVDQPLKVIKPATKKPAMPKSAGDQR